MTGRGVAEHFGVLGEVDVITSTLGKALGGAAGGFVAASEEVCDAALSALAAAAVLERAAADRRRSRARGGRGCCGASPRSCERLRSITATSARGSREIGFAPLDGEAAIIPIIVGETAFAIGCRERLLDEGVFVTGFGFPVVPEGTARIRVQMSAALEDEHLDRALAAFERVGNELGLI